MTATPEVPCSCPPPPPPPPADPRGAVSAALGAMHAHTGSGTIPGARMPGAILGRVCSGIPVGITFLTPLFIRKHTTAERSRESQVFS